MTIKVVISKFIHHKIMYGVFVKLNSTINRVGRRADRSDRSKSFRRQSLSLLWYIFWAISRVAIVAIRGYTRRVW